MHVHEHVGGAAAQLAKDSVRFGERRTRRFQEQHPRQVHDAQAHAVLLDDRVAAPRRRLRVVRRPHDPLVAVEQLVDVAVTERVVAERDRIGAGIEQRHRDLGRDPDAAGGVLAVDHDEVDALALDQPGQQPLDDRAPRGSDDVADEEHLHDQDRRVQSWPSRTFCTHC